MDRILLISLYEPCEFGGHVGGCVILINDILSALDEDMDVDLLVYNKENINSVLPDNVRFLPWSSLAEKKKGIDFGKIFPRLLCKDYPLYSINLSGYNKIIYYPYFCSLFKLKNSNAEFFTIGMDSGPMLYLRGLLNHRRLIYRLFCLSSYMQALYIDRKAAAVSKKVFTVGETDAEFYHSVFLADARFVSHPVTKLIEHYRIREWKADEKLAICFPGGLSRFYTAELLDEILYKVMDKSELYKDKISISFLGKIKYKKLQKELQLISDKGIEVNNTEYAESFEEYLSAQHLILLPLRVGAGTKNRCLSALGMGLDVIGTPIALENVYGISDKNTAFNADDFIRLIDMRLLKHRLYGLPGEKIVQFKEYHSVKKWNQYFWKEVRK